MARPTAPTHSTAARDARPRAWCAREALHASASWGMWAGIWIDGTAEPDAVPYLRAHCAHWPSTSAGVFAARPRPRRPAARRHCPDRSRLWRSSDAPRRQSSLPARRVIARSSTSGCRLTVRSATVGRVGRYRGGPESPHRNYSAACGPLCGMVAALAPEARASNSATVATPAAAWHTPVRWRQVRWVLLGSRGELTECGLARSERVAAVDRVCWFTAVNRVQSP